MKSRFSSLDVRAMVNSMRPEAVGCKLANVYDINSRVYILKLSRTNYKRFLLLESGVRVHLTNYERDKNSLPSNYTMKLRKHIRTKRLTDIQQVGSDRVVDLTFGKGDTAFHLILELYVSGNLILTDHEYKILVLLRTHNDGEHSKVAVRQFYPLDKATGLLAVPREAFRAEVERLMDIAADRENEQLDVEDENEEERTKKLGGKKVDSAFAKRSRKKVRHSGFPVVSLLHKLAPFADPGLCASSVAAAMREEGKECANAFKLVGNDMPLDELVPLLQRAADKALETLRSVSRPGDLGGGDMRPVEAVPEDEAAGGDAEEADSDAEEAGAELPSAAVAVAPKPWEAPSVAGWITRRLVHVPPQEPSWTNDEFTPLPPEPGGDPEAQVHFVAFHQCVDEFYAKLESSRAEEHKAQKAQSAYAKVDRVREDQQRRIEQLEAEQNQSEIQASLIEANVDIVEQALGMLNAMVASQIDWGELWREVKRQQKLGSPLAQHIHSLDLERNEFRLLLGGRPEDDDLEAGDTPMAVVPLDLSLSAHANVARLHSQRKQWREKTSKTVVQAETAVKQMEKKVQHDLNKFHLKQTIKRVRHTWGFEKFLWFISSENYLVISGRDVTQAEQLLARHVGPQDVFVAADVQGARSCFVKNPGGGEVPPATLREAGTMSLCYSAAWDKRIVISAWWVFADQVTRGPPPTSDCVLADGFHVHGQRRFMPPLRLEMGLGLLFHVAGPGAEKHKGERKSRYLEAIGAAGGDGAAEAQEPDSDSGEGEELLEEKAAGGGEALEEPEAGEAEDVAEDEARAEEHEEVEPCNDDRGEEEQADDSAKMPTAEQLEEKGEVEEASRGGGDAAEADAPSGGRMSAAERRRMKKGKSGEAPPLPPPPSEPTPKAKAKAAAKAEAAAKAKAAAVLPRGQKAKQKKMKEKYAEQDEDERELRLALLGSKATKHEAGVAEAEAEAEEDSGEGAAAPDASREVPEAAPDRPPASAGPGAAGAGRGREAPRPGRPAPAIARTLTAGCDAESNPVDLQLENLDLLTGQPAPDDEVLYAMVMSAPYCAMGGPYNFRVKLTPGPTKKGQAAKTCLRMFETQIEKPAWKQLVSAIPEQETAGLLCGSAKLTMPGLQKVQQQMKKEKQRDMRAKDQEKQKQATKKA